MNKDEIKIPGPPVGYTDLLDYEITNKLEKENKEFQQGIKKRYFPLRPSAAGYCSRKLAYSLMQYHGYADYNTPVTKPETHRLFQLGHSVEYSVLQLFNLVDLVHVKYKQAPLTCAVLGETDTEPRRIIEGACDGCFYSDIYKGIFDVKSVKDGFSKAFTTRWTETLDKYSNMESVIKISDTAFYVDDIYAFMNELGEDFLIENIVQLNLYACTDFMKERGIDHCVIYKYNKNDSRHYELRFKPSDQLAIATRDKFNTIVQTVEKKDVENLPRSYNLGSLHCAFCEYNSVCWPEADAKREYFRTFPKKSWPVDIDTLNNEALKALFNEYEIKVKQTEDLHNIEEQIINILHNNDIKRIQLENKHIYEIKKLKSPKEHFELRRSKL